MNGANDAEAIREAVTLPTVRFVLQKTVEHRDLQCLRRMRSHVACRTQLVNQIRGLLADYRFTTCSGLVPYALSVSLFHWHISSRADNPPVWFLGLGQVIARRP